MVHAWIFMFALICRLVTQATTSSLEVESVTSWFHLSNTTFYHMEPDYKVEGNFIISTRNQLFTYNGNSVSLIAGNDVYGFSDGSNSNARFNMITEFVQVDSQLIIVADTNNHCIRSITRFESDSTLVSTLSGRCLSAGDTLGSINSTLMRFPRSVSLDDSLYIADTGNHRILKSDVSETSGTAVVKVLDIPSPHSIEFTSGDILMVLSREGLYKYNTNNQTLSVITRAGLPQDGWLSDCTTIPGCMGVTTTGLHYIYQTDTLLFSEAVSPYNGVSKIRYVDFPNNWIGSICSGSPGHKPGGQNVCEITPRCALYSDGIIYIGGREHIWRTAVISGERKTLSTIDQLEFNATLLKLTTIVDLLSTSKSQTSVTNKVDAGGAVDGDLDKKSSSTLIVILIFLIGLTALVITILLVIWVKRRHQPELEDKTASVQNLPPIHGDESVSDQKLPAIQGDEVTPSNGRSTHNEP